MRHEGGTQHLHSSASTPAISPGALTQSICVVEDERAAVHTWCPRKHACSDVAASPICFSMSSSIFSSTSLLHPAPQSRLNPPQHRARRPRTTDWIAVALSSSSCTSTSSSFSSAFLRPWHKASTNHTGLSHSPEMLWRCSGSWLLPRPSPWSSPHPTSFRPLSDPRYHGAAPDMDHRVTATCIHEQMSHLQLQRSLRLLLPTRHLG